MMMMMMMISGGGGGGAAIPQRLHISCKGSFVLFAGNVGACQELPQGLNIVDAIN